MLLGWIKYYRCTLENPVVMRDAVTLGMWTYLLLNAAHSPVPIMFKGEKYILQPGEFSTGRKRIAEDLGLNESQVQRILKIFEKHGQIEQRTDRQCRVISICNWEEYQSSEQRANNERTTSEQRANTKQEYKEYKECNNNPLNPPYKKTEEEVEYDEWFKSTFGDVQ